MAEITVYVSDDKILEYLRDKRELDLGSRAANVNVSVKPVPLVANSSVSHEVTVSVTYGLQIGELRSLTEF